MEKKIEIVIGASAPSITEQCARLNLEPTGLSADLIDRISEAITLSYIHGILTAAETDRARTRLLKKARFCEQESTE